MRWADECGPGFAFTLLALAVANIILRVTIFAYQLKSVQIFLLILIAPFFSFSQETLDLNNLSFIKKYY